MAPYLHLDNDQSVFFENQLEIIRREVTFAKMAPLKSRQLIPTLEGIPEWAHSMKWRLFDQVGEAQFITDYAAALPRADAFGTEGVRVIKPLGASYGYSLDELRESAATGTPLDQLRARAARRAIETLIDKTLAFGSEDHGLEGLLNLTNAGTFTPEDKDDIGDSSKAWGTIASPNASGIEIARDIMGIATDAYIASNEAFESFVVVLPPEQYATAAGTLIDTGNGSNITALEFAMRSPHVERVETWTRLKGAGDGGDDRMLAYPMDPEVVGGIVPQEYTEEMPQLQNLSYVVPARARCGGVISRHPKMVRYGDGI